MRLGINATVPHETPQQWAELAAAKGYRASSFPVDHTAPVSVIDAYVAAAKEYDILIAEVGVWNTPHHPDPAIAAKARERCLEQLRLAEYIKANCCVNISGAPGERWDFVYPENFSQELYAKNVEFVQYLLDTVKPEHTAYTLEPMPWMLPDSPEQYLQFLKDVNRKGCKVHMDIWNMVKDPYIYTHLEDHVRGAFELLGPEIVSCHIKDIWVRPGSTFTLEEVPIGTGTAPLGVYLDEISKLQPDMPVLIEHLSKQEEYDAALAYLKGKYGDRYGI